MSDQTKVKEVVKGAPLRKRLRRKLDFLKGIDLYAKPFELTYKGRAKHTTFYGAGVSLGVIAIVIIFFVFKLIQMVQYQQSTIRKNTLIDTSNDYQSPFVWDDKDFTIAFALTDISGINVVDNKKYGKFILRQQNIQNKQLANGTIIKEKTVTDIPYELCSNFSNSMSNEFNLIQLGLQNYYCAKWKNLTIQGSFLSPEYQTIQLIYQKCQGSNCANDTEFQKWIPSAIAEVRYISSYFDTKNYDKPIQRYVESLFYPLELSYCTYSQIQIKNTSLTLKDSLFAYVQTPVEDNFYTVGEDVISKVDKQTFGKDFLFFQAWRMGKEYDDYERVVYSFQNLLQDVGGFQSSIHIIGLILYYRFRDVIYFSTLVTKIYQMENINNIEDSENKDKSISQVHSKLIHQQSGTEVINQIIDSVHSRIKIRLNWSDLVRLATIGSACLRNNSSQNRKRLVYKNAKLKITQELDCVSILHKLQMIEHMSSIIMSQAQRILFYYQKKFAVSEEIHQTKALVYEKSFSIKKMQQVHDFDKALRLVCSQDNLQNIDKRLLWGLVSNKPFSVIDHSKYYPKNAYNTKRTDNLDQSIQLSDEETKQVNKQMPLNPDEEVERALQNLQVSKENSSYLYLWKQTHAAETKGNQIHPVNEVKKNDEEK